MSKTRPSVMIGLFLIALPTLAARAGSLTTLHQFTSQTDGMYPRSGLVYRNGVLYGATLLGGQAGQGTIYKVDATSGAESLLYSFTGGQDGGLPSAVVFRGNVLYGTTPEGGGGPKCFGGQGYGTAFRINPDTGAKTTLLTFAGGAQGDTPESSMIVAGGLLYGTTTSYCTGGGLMFGTVYKLDPATRTQTVLHDFGQNDGQDPVAPLLSLNGKLYGMTSQGGTGSCSGATCGTVFSIDPLSGTETLLHTFRGGSDGFLPEAGLIAKGNFLYGTTNAGGAAASGTVFQIDLTTGQERVLYDFSDPRGGAYPIGQLVYHNGALYGTANEGGDFNRNCVDSEQRTGCGTIFRIDVQTGAQTVLYRFTGGADSAYPAGLIYVDGAFYGSTGGSVFKFVP